jgi:hypothetical protein
MEIPKILVIDDGKDFQDTTGIVLEKNGFQVISAYDPE